MTRYTKYYLASIAILLSAFLINAQFASTPVNRWTKSSDMSIQRASACSVQLADGKVLVAGGRSDASVSNTVEVTNADGSFGVVASMSQARAGAACIALPDGRVLVTGGNDGASNLASAEIYDPRKDTWTAAGEMSVARSGHTATRTPWGAILLTGGEDSGAVELFLLNDTFTTLGVLATARTDHAIAATYDHKVIIAGGSHNGAALNTVEIYDGDTGKIIPGGAMLSARRNFAAAPLLDGTVLIAGGFGADGAVLNSTEIFDPQKGTSVSGPAMSSARANHKLMALASNGRVLIVGGVDENSATASSEIYTPWTGKLATLPSMLRARQQMVAAPLRRGAVIVAGGKGDNGSLAAAEVFAYATIDTDKTDYAPGEQVIFSGSGWKPGEQVLLQVSAFPLDQHILEYTAVTQANSAGQIRITPFNIDRSHLGVRFLATATGSESQAQNTFTDGQATTTSLNLSSASNPYNSPVTPTGHVTGSVTNPVSSGTVAISIDGAAAYSTVAVQLNGDYAGAAISTLGPGIHHFTATYGAGGAIWNDSTSPQADYLVTAGTSTTMTSPSGTVALGASLTFSATVSGAESVPNPSNGTVNFIDVGAGNAIVATASVGVGGTASTSLSTLPSNNQTPYSLAAVYVPIVNNGYSGSQSTNQSLTVNRNTPAPTVTPSPASTVFGDMLTLTACVPAVAGITPTGSLSLKDGAALISGSLSLSGGCASLQLATLTGGPHNITTVYAGDTNYNPAISSAVGFNVTKAATTGSITFNPVSPVTLGTSVQLQGTVSSTAQAATGTAPGGALNATFQDNNVDIPGCVALTVNVGSVNCNLVTPALGTHPITLKYLNLDQNYASSISPIFNLVVSKPNTTTSLSADQSTISIGGSVTYTASVQGTPASSGNPDGSVTFYDGGSTPIPGCSAVPVSAANPAIATCTKVYDASVPVLGPGTHQVTAVYPLTATFNGSTSTAVTLTVNKLQPVASSLTVTVASPITYATADTLRAVFGPAPSGPALGAGGGNVLFFDGINQIGTVAVVSGGNTDLALPDSVIKSVGTHTLTARYSGDDNYLASVGPFPTVSLVVDKAPVTITPTTPGGTLVYGSSQTFAATVTSAVGTPTGTITWTSGGITIGTATLPSTSITVNLTMLPQGLNPITITYSGDTNFAGKADTTTSVTVGKATPSASISTSPVTPVAFAASLILTGTFTPPGAGTLTGTVDFKDGSTLLNSVPVTISGGQANFTLASPLAPGAHSLTAIYNGDANFTPATSAASALTVNAATTTTALTLSTATPAVGDTVTFSAAVTPQAGGPANPTGTVAIRDANTNTVLCSIVLPAVSCNVIYNGTPVETAPGAHSVIAAYTSGNSTNWSSSASTAMGITVGLTPTTVSTPTSGAGNSYSYGTTTAFTAVVSPHTGSPSFTGTVQFFDGGTPVGAAIVPNAATGSVTSAPILLAVGTHNITAQFGGDISYSFSPVSGSLAVTVAKSTPNPITLIPAPAYVTTYAGLLTTGATTVPVVGSGVTPTGTVTLSSNGIVIATGALSGGNYTFTNVQMPNTINAGAGQNLTVTYNGDGNYTAASFVSANGLTVNAATSTAVVTSSAAGSVPNGQNVIFTVTLTGPGNPANGTISFTSDGNPINASCTSPAGVVIANIATCTAAATAANNLGAGSHVISVVNFVEANGNHVLGTVTGISSLVVSPPAAQVVVTSSQNPSVFGQSVTFTGTVTGPLGGPSPTGQVQFFDGSSAIGGSQTIVGTTASFVTTLSVGQHVITARYAGDATYATSTSPQLVQVVNKASTATSLSSTPASPNPGQSVTFTAAVTVTAPGSGTPTGTVQFINTSAGQTVLGTSPLVANGNVFTATLAVTQPQGGANIVAVYSGDTGYATSSSAPLVQGPPSNRPAAIVSLASSKSPSIVGDPVTFAIVVTPPSTGGGIPTGTVTIYSDSKELGQFTLINGQYNFVTSSLPVGDNYIRVYYAGDGQFGPADSRTIIQQVRLRTSLGIASSAPTAIASQIITFTAVLSPTSVTGFNSAGGQVSFYDGSNLLGSTNLLSNVATLSLANLAVGLHQISAVYVGDNSWSAASSGPYPQLVNKAPTVTTLTAQPIGSAPNQSIGLTAVITVPPPSVFGLAIPSTLKAEPPTGTVQFVDTTAGKTLGTAPLTVVNGVFTATLNIDQFSKTATPPVVTATYSGDSSFLGSTSGPISQIAVVNGAGYTTSNFAPDSWVTIFGDNLATGQLTASTIPYPTSLGGASVSLVDANGVPRLLPLYFVSPGQINALIPTDTAVGVATLTVTKPQGATASASILITRTAPGIFSANASGANVAAALIQRVRPDNSQTIENIATYDAASNRMVPLPIAYGSDRLFLQIYGTGIRYTPSLAKVTVTVGGKDAPVLYASTAPGYFGLDQVNVQLPTGLTGTVNIVVTVDGQVANTVTMTFK